MSDEKPTGKMLHRFVPASSFISANTLFEWRVRLPDSGKKHLTRRLAGSIAHVCMLAAQEGFEFVGVSREKHTHILHFKKQFGKNPDPNIFAEYGLFSTAKMPDLTGDSNELSTKQD